MVLYCKHAVRLQYKTIPDTTYVTSIYLKFRILNIQNRSGADCKVMEELINLYLLNDL